MRKTDKMKSNGNGRNKGNDRAAGRKVKRAAASLGLCATLGLSALCGCSEGTGQSGADARTDADALADAVKLSGSPAPGQGGTLSGAASVQGTPAPGGNSVQDGSQGDAASTQGGSQAGAASALGGSRSQDKATPADASTVTDFALRLFQESLAQEQAKDAGKNVLVSPTSVLFALSMTANGAKGETLTQMEDVLGASVSGLNTYLHEYRTSLPDGDGYKLSLANSVWFRDDERFTVNADFLDLNEKWYDADIYRAPFDSSTVKAVNQWVSQATDNMIPEILEKIPQDAVMYLINGLAFDAEWDTIYKQHDVRKADFTEEGGSSYRTEMMYSTEGLYLQDEQAQGFLKYYKDGKYAFAALLPNEGISLADYAASLDGKALHEMLSSPVQASVAAAIPKFETAYDVEMNGIFTAMGMTDAFDFSTADLSGIGSSTAGNLFINRILHKTYIAVDERGTRAGAVTSVEINDECAPLLEHEVYLSRPFIYMIVDCKENVPVFIGAVKCVK